jgi:hypothetical protein
MTIDRDPGGAAMVRSVCVERRASSEKEISPISHGLDTTDQDGITITGSRADINLIDVVPEAFSEESSDGNYGHLLLVN